MSKISIEVTEEQHGEIKALAALKGKSIREFIIDLIFKKTGHEETLEAIREIKRGGGTRYKNTQSMMDDILGDARR